MRTDFLACRLLPLGVLACGISAALARGALDDAAVATELSRMGCHVEVTLDAGALTVERVEKYEDLSDRLFIELKKLGQLGALSLWLPAGEPSSACLRELTSLPTLRELALTGTEVTDEVACYVAGLTNLETLKLYSVSISEAGLVRLATLKALKRLELRNLRTITCRGLGTIATLTNLEEIAIAGRCEKGALLALRSLAKLTTISIGGLNLGDQLAELKTMPHVKVVKIVRATISPTTADDLLAMRSLESLEMECCHIEPDAVRRLQSLHLKRLDCHATRCDALDQLLKAVSPPIFWELRAVR